MKDTVHDVGTGVTAEEVVAELLAMRDPARAELQKRYFKTGPGQYGEGDEFLGIGVPVLRKRSRALRAIALSEVLELLYSPYHEARLLAVLAMVEQYQRGNQESRQHVYDLYLENAQRINNWDLVDSSAEHIIGAHLLGRDRKVLKKLARSKSIWERRIAVLSTFHFIRNGEFQDSLELAEFLIDDREDLVHKAVGWMLREVGRRDRQELDEFLSLHYERMPRTMLRYAIEKHEPGERRRYLDGTI